MKRILLLLLLVWGTVAYGEQRVALVIGNGAYRDGPLRNPPNDARAMAQALRECDFHVRGELWPLPKAKSLFLRQIDHCKSREVT